MQCENMMWCMHMCAVCGVWCVRWVWGRNCSSFTAHQITPPQPNHTHLRLSLSQLRLLVRVPSQLPQTSSHTKYTHSACTPACITSELRLLVPVPSQLPQTRSHTKYTHSACPPACMTSELRLLVPVPNAGADSSSSTSWPACATARAHARPTTPEGACVCVDFKCG